MRMTTQRSTRGKHRKITTSQTTKGRIALVTVATGAVSTAGIGGAAAAQIQANDTEAETTVTATPEYELAANTSDIAAQVAEAGHAGSALRAPSRTRRCAHPPSSSRPRVSSPPGTARAGAPSTPASTSPTPWAPRSSP